MWTKQARTKKNQPHLLGLGFARHNPRAASLRESIRNLCIVNKHTLHVDRGLFNIKLEESQSTGATSTWYYNKLVVATATKLDANI